jgi:hypothetical protein
MFRFLFASILIILGCVNSAHAEESSGMAPHPNYGIGGGVGFTSLLHIDYQNWINEKSSIEVGLTPMLLHNVLLVAYNHHINLKTEGTRTHNLVASGGYLGIANLGFIFNGVGARVGYEILGDKRGFSLVVGGFVSPDELKALPSVRLTIWGLKRKP